MPLKNSNSFTNPGYRVDIDFLRGIAIFSVVLYHANVPGFSGGFLGVDVFFVLSGFLITRILLQEIVGGSFSIAEFWARRIRRILPALVLVLVSTFGLIKFLAVTSGSLTGTVESGQAAALFFSNLYFFHAAEDYFSVSHEQLPLLHTWSLSIEEQFYLFWPILLLLIVKFGEVYKRSFLKTLGYVLIIIGSISFYYFYVQSTNKPMAAFFLMPARAWELAIGAGLAYVERFQPNLPLVTRRIIFIIGLSGLGLVIYDRGVFGVSTPIFAIISTLSAALMIISNLSQDIAGKRIYPISRPVIFVGILSYSWYLWHWPLLSLSRIYRLGDRDFPLDIAICLLALILAWFTYTFVETPIRKKSIWFVSDLSKTYVTGFLLVTTAVSLGYLTVSVGDGRQLVATDIPPTQRTCNQEGEFQGLPKVTDCSVGAKNGPIRVVVWGDSHASYLMPMVAEWAERHGSLVLHRTRSGCPPLVSITSYSPALFHKSIDLHCAAFNRAVIEEITEMSKQGLVAVVLNARWPLYLAQPTPNPRETGIRALVEIHENVVGEDYIKTGIDVGVPPYDMNTSIKLLQHGLENTLVKLEGLGLRVMIFSPIPELYYPANECLARLEPSRCGLTRERVDQRRVPVHNAINAVTEQHQNSLLVNVTDDICDGDFCRAERDGIRIFNDEDHLTATFSAGYAKLHPVYGQWLFGKSSE